MYTPNDIHRIVGFLYLSSRSSDVRLTLGERVLDAATGTRRDVDIVIARSGSTGLIGAEVKAERTPLDTPIVEGLVAKLNDMASVTTKQIVSKAGFTAPAVRKAEAHGVQCFKLVEAPLPAFQPIDMSGLRTLEYVRRKWARHDSLLMVPSSTPAGIQDVLRGDLTQSGLEVTWGASRLDVRSFRNAALMDVLNKLELPLEAAEHAIKRTLVFDPEPVLHAPGADVLIEALQVSGRVQVERTSIPADQNSVYLQAMDGTAISGAALIEVPEGLLGIAAADGASALQLFSIPAALRSVRPNREVITLSIGK